MSDILYMTEHDIEKKILDFQEKLGIVDENNVVNNDDFEFTVDVPLSGKEAVYE